MEKKFRVTGHLCGKFTGPRWIPHTKASDANVFFDLRPNKLLSKHWWGWWFETPSHPLWRHRNGATFNCGRFLRPWQKLSLPWFQFYHQWRGGTSAAAVDKKVGSMQVWNFATFQRHIGTAWNIQFRSNFWRFICTVFFLAWRTYSGHDFPG